MASNCSRNARLDERRSQFRHDAAGDEDASSRAQRERKVAGHGAKHGAKHLRRLTRAWIFASDLRVGDLRRLELRGWKPRQFAKGVVQIDKARPGEDSLRRHMIIPPPHKIQDGAFSRAGWRHRHMSALALNGDCPPIGRNQRTHAETGARSDDADGRAADRRPVADLDAIGLA